MGKAQWLRESGRILPSSLLRRLSCNTPRSMSSSETQKTRSPPMMKTSRSQSCLAAPRGSLAKVPCVAETNQWDVLTRRLPTYHLLAEGGRGRVPLLLRSTNPTPRSEPKDPCFYDLLKAITLVKSTTIAPRPLTRPASPLSITRRPGDITFESSSRDCEPKSATALC